MQTNFLAARRGPNGAAARCTTPPNAELDGGSGSRSAGGATGKMSTLRTASSGGSKREFPRLRAAKCRAWSTAKWANGRVGRNVIRFAAGRGGEQVPEMYWNFKNK